MVDPKPLASWENQDSSHPDLVWWTRLDGRWQIEVHHTSDYAGVLCVFDTQNDLHCLAQQEVSISYSAPFGPDVADVADWQAIALELVDRQPN